MHHLRRFRFYYVLLFIYFIFQLLIIGFLKTFEPNDSFKTMKALGLYNKFLLELSSNSYRDKSNSYRILCLQCSETNISTFGITLISQCSANHIQKIEDLHAAWQGPMSVSVFTDGKDITKALWELTKFLYCKDRKNLQLQLVLPDKDFIAGYHHEVELADENTHKLPLCKFHHFVTRRNYNHTNPYPINLLRNVAKSKSHTDYIMTVDIDMIPSSNLRKDFLDYIILNNLSGKKTAYVVPIFESKTDIMLPRTKENLIEQIKLKKVRPFYFRPCRNCQKYSRYNNWLNTNTSSGTKVLYDVQWKHPWEPFFIARRDIPDFDERFKQYGMNRVSQICELYVAGYKFSVLDNVFLVHRGFKEINSFHVTKNAELKTNRNLYTEFKKNLKFKYPKSKRKC